VMLWKRKKQTRMQLAHERFRRRAAQVRRRPWRYAGGLLAVLLLAAGVVYLFGFSPAFVVKEVHVEGAEGDFAEEVVAAAAVPQGVPLARVDTGAVATRVLEDLRVREVEVQRSWPSGITLVVEPRQPALAVSQSGKPMQLADASGVLYDTVKERPKGVPQVGVSSGDVDPASLVGVLEMRAALPDEILEDVRGMRITSRGELRFDLGSVRVEWGPPEQATLKATVLGALLQQSSIDPEAENTISVDLSVPSTPVVTGMPLAEED
jgi:cell division protein FtsQ